MFAGSRPPSALRSREAEARITVVSDEHDHFFSRPALMYVFAGQTSLRDTEPYDRGLYERMGFERVRRRVATVDTPGRALVFEDGSRLTYDKLLLAVGSRGRPAPWPGSEGPGLHYTYEHPVSTRQGLPWLASVTLFLAYIILYFGGNPSRGFAADPIESLARVLLPASIASKWTLYGLAYSAAMVAGGWFVLKRHGNSPYQRIRTTVVVLVQVILAFALPLVLKVFTHHEHYFSYFWPLKIEYLYPSYILQQPFLILVWSFAGSLVAFPLLGYFFGKRFYCSWICGCGGLANTAGEPWRHLSDKSPRAWKIERVSIHTVLFLALVTTAIVWINWSIGKQHPDFARFAFKVQDWYGFLIGAMFAGPIGVGLYPLMGTRVWCRFGCPMAALLGLVQKFGRFRITVKKDMCISCGNCSTYCEMGIDVRAYAMANLGVKRASCVGCGMCAHVCPRGVLKLENKADRFKGGTPIRVYAVDL